MPDKISLLLTPVFLLCLLGLPLPEVSASPAPIPEQQVEKIQDIYRDLTSLSFYFSQLTRTGGRGRQGAGTAIFYRPGSKPGVMRWDYTEPDTQIILNDGKKLSIYTQTGQPGDRHLGRGAAIRYHLRFFCRHTKSA